jgi:hypothetical protein
MLPSLPSPCCSYRECWTGKATDDPIISSPQQPLLPSLRRLDGEKSDLSITEKGDGGGMKGVRTGGLLLPHLLGGDFLVAGEFASALCVAFFLCRWGGRTPTVSDFVSCSWAGSRRPPSPRRVSSMMAGTGRRRRGAASGRSGCLFEEGDGAFMVERLTMEASFFWLASRALSRWLPRAIVSVRVGVKLERGV